MAVGMSFSRSMTSFERNSSNVSTKEKSVLL